MKTVESEAFRIAEEIHKGALVTDGEVRRECRYAAEEISGGANEATLYRAVESAYRAVFKG